MYKPIGWFKIHRKLFENQLYSNLEMRGAFVTLIGKANWQPDQTWFCKREMRLIPVAIGQFPCSQQALAKEFGWGVNRMRNFLKLLEKDGVINIKSERNFTMITICNYSKYQEAKGDVGTQTDMRTDTHIDTQTDMRTDHVIRSKENIRSKEVKNTTKHLSGAEIIKDLPIEFHTSEMIQSFDNWLNYKKTEKRQTYKSTVSFKQLPSKFNPKELIEAINYSIMQSYSGIYADKNAQKPNAVLFQKQTNYEKNIETLKKSLEKIQGDNLTPFERMMIECGGNK